jgi:hypothetical protein
MQNAKQIKKAWARARVNAMERAVGCLAEAHREVAAGRKPNWLKMGVALGELDSAGVDYEDTQFNKEVRQIQKAASKLS